MKKSKLVTLVLITASLASCHTAKYNRYNDGDQVYYEPDQLNDGTDSSLNYNQNPWQWYYSFRPYSTYYLHNYRHHIYGYGSGVNLNVRFQKGKIATVRGGFGRISSAVS